MGFEGLHYYFDIVYMISFATGVNKDVINEDYDKNVQVLLEHLIHQVHEGYWGIGKTKGHD